MGVGTKEGTDSETSGRVEAGSATDGVTETNGAGGSDGGAGGIDGVPGVEGASTAELG